MTRISRTDKSVVAEWWWTVDRWTLAAVLLLMGLGILLCMAASPPVAQRIGAPEFHFVSRQMIYLIPSILILLASSMLSAVAARRIALVVAASGLVLMVMTILVGPEVKGATRWLNIGGLSIQPSEFVKPAFVVLTAWLFSEATQRKDIPGNMLSVGFYGIFIILLILQPDIGQTILVTASWGLMFFLAGLSWAWILSLGVIAICGVMAAYVAVPHVTTRIDRFINPESGDTYQVDVALQSFANGGLLGRGPGEGTVKHILPDAHSDFIFAVVAEEYGVLACMVLVAIFAFIVVRGLNHCLAETDPFRRLATAGLIGLFGLQAVINMGVNVNLLPAKGMTLPFISYGGSSLMSMALTIGFALAFMRRRPAGQMPRNIWAPQHFVQRVAG